MATVRSYDNWNSFNHTVLMIELDLALDSSIQDKQDSSRNMLLFLTIES